MKRDWPVQTPWTTYIKHYNNDIEHIKRIEKLACIQTNEQARKITEHQTDVAF